MTYYKLIDELNFGEIVKKDNGKCYTFCYGPDVWIRSAIMVRYDWPDDALYEQYMIISQKKAEELIEQQKEKLNRLLVLAIEVATNAHEGQYDKGGRSYINHPKAVADSLDSTEQKIVAYLHDVCEDTSISFDNLLEMGFTERIVNSIRLLTKADDVPYEEYIKSIKKDSNAWHVKMADLKHNMDLSRIINPTQKDCERVEKYKKALEFLEN